MRKMFSLLLIALVPATVTAQSFVNWENHPTHALDLSPDGSMLAIAHTADARVQLFDVSTGLPVFAGTVPVGLDPVSVRFRTDTELWVVNHISDSISIVDVAQRAVITTLATADEPFDLVFGNGNTAFVSASQVNRVQVFDTENLASAAREIIIDAEDPRAMAVSPDGSTVYVAIFESGNGTTLVAGSTNMGDFPPNGATDTSGPYGGQNPPPNDGDGFTPAINPQLATAPKVGQIVRRAADGRWLDDNGGDWTSLVSGSNANRSGRVPGWDLPDRDLAVIDVASLQVSYVSRLMNAGMAVAVNPSTGEVLLVGTDAQNEIRFEPNVNGIFARVHGALVSANGADISDLNPHLTYLESTVDPSQRKQSIGDPRGIVWRADGSEGYVAGMGSNNVLLINSSGQRVESASPIEVGEGPTSLVLSQDQARLFVWNHFSAQMSVVDIGLRQEITRVSVHNPLPDSIRRGRRHFYNTHETSGLGHVSCASCHIDGRTDRLAWDLGNPGGDVKLFNQNCNSLAVGVPCSAFHPLKGPMVTQTMQDIIGKEPLHWRGDRDGLEEFNPAFVSLLGDDQMLTESQMQEFEDFLATLTFAPNPYRQNNNNLSNQVDLSGHVTSGRFGTAGQPLGTGNAIRGRQLFLNETLVALPDNPGIVTSCGSCHTVPTGLGSNGPVNDPFLGTRIGGRNIATGPQGENHLHVTGQSTLTAGTFKVPQLRNMYEKTGMSLTNNASRAGFGFLHDGAIDTLAEFVSLDEFTPESDQDVADMVAFLLSFSGSGIGATNNGHLGEVPNSLDTHAAVGRQVTVAGASDFPTELLTLANTGAVDVVARNSEISWLYDDETFAADDGSGSLTPAQLQTLASTSDPLTIFVVPVGSGRRLALDRDSDGILNGVELQQGSSPADPASNTFRPLQGLWYNPARSGHGVDIQLADNLVAGTWYTYGDDGTPVWYQATGPLNDRAFSADLLRYERNTDGSVTGTTVGTMSFAFAAPNSATFSWVVDGRSGSEAFERFAFADSRPLRQLTGLWFDPSEPGYGLSIDTLGDTRVVVAYFYDANSQPRWVIGQSANRLSSTADMVSVSGFCPDCAFIETTTSAGGSVQLNFSELARETVLTLDVSYPSLSGSMYQRQATLIPLTSVPVNLEQ